MAKRLTPYELAKQQGGKMVYKILINLLKFKELKNSLLKSGIRVGEIEIEAYLQKNGSKSIDVVKYFTQLYGPGTGINRGQDETTFF